MELYNIFEVIAGIVACILIFYRRPFLNKTIETEHEQTVSVIIPARNEAENLQHLLADLKAQTRQVDQIICVDDFSDDDTAGIVTAFGATLVTSTEIPHGWTGKSWACESGAKVATGALLLFLDADVRLHPDAVAKLENTYQQNQCTLSVKPFHTVKRWYEQFSFFFNLIQIAANGLGWPFKENYIGLFGPVILISKEVYRKIGGHASVKGSVVEDVALGEVLKKNGLAFQLFIGGNDIRFRMYPDGVSQLVEGWTKNMISGALKTPLIILMLLILWFGAITSVFVNLLRALVAYNFFSIFTYLALYLIVLVLLWWASFRVGNFKLTAIVCYPILLLACFVIFSISILNRFFFKRTIWKGRTIRLGGAD
ncbi:MAG: glycosyltransferase [Clostridia bacterium]